MDEFKKPIPHFVRVSDVISTDPVVKHREIKQLKNEVYQDKKLRRMCSKSSLVTVDRIKELNCFKVSDFSMENLQAIGANLNPVHLIGSTESAISTLESKLSKIS